MLSGGTNTGNALAHLNRILDRSPIVLIVSDNQSWITQKNFDHFHSATPALAEWEKYRRRVKNAKLICLDLQPEASAQVPEREDVLHIGGWSESVFEIIRDFVQGESSGFVEEIEKVELF
jgi:60 kDa SS-A/Ro ribonucleoprotein